MSLIKQCNSFQILSLLLSTFGVSVEKHESLSFKSVKEGNHFYVFVQVCLTIVCFLSGTEY
jgi:hypothetical protein